MFLIMTQTIKQLRISFVSNPCHTIATMNVKNINNGQSGFWFLKNNSEITNSHCAENYVIIRIQ